MWFLPVERATMTAGKEPRSIVLASQYRVRDPARMWTAMKNHLASLSRLGAHHVVVYRSTADPCEVLVTIGVHTHQPIANVLGSDAVLQWFDIAGVIDIPPVFVGTIVEKITLAPSTQMPPGIVLAATAPIDDVTTLINEIHRVTERFIAAGIRKLWIYEAVDQPNEVLVLQELDDATRARQWIDLPDAAAQWMTRAGLRVYPPLFVGTLMEVLAIHPRRGGHG
jgi:hypothetical protein